MSGATAYSKLIFWSWCRAMVMGAFLRVGQILGVCHLKPFARAGRRVRTVSPVARSFQACAPRRLVLHYSAARRLDSRCAATFVEQQTKGARQNSGQALGLAKGISAAVILPASAFCLRLNNRSFCGDLFSGIDALRRTMLRADQCPPMFPLRSRSGYRQAFLDSQCPFSAGFGHVADQNQVVAVSRV